MNIAARAVTILTTYHSISTPAKLSRNKKLSLFSKHSGTIKMFKDVQNDFARFAESERYSTQKSAFTNKVKIR
jgi:hypothetical protein